MTTVTTAFTAEILTWIKTKVMGNGAMCGQYIGQGVTGPLSTIAQLTGVNMAMPGIDYFGFGDTLAMGPNYTAANKAAIVLWNAGSIPTISFCLPCPATGGPCNDLSMTSAQWTHLVTPGTAINKAYINLLQQIGQGLLQLQNAGVVAMMRFMHEMNAGPSAQWWWWNTISGTDAQFCQAYRLAYDTWTAMGIVNLIRVYGANGGPGPILGRYNPIVVNNVTVDPGLAAYTDMVGASLYTNDPTEFMSIYNTFKPLGLPMLFSEFGPGGTTQGNAAFNFTTLVSALQNYPMVVGWQEWWSANNGVGWGHELSNAANLKQALTSKWVFTQANLNRPVQGSTIVANTSTTPTTTTIAATIAASTSPTFVSLSGFTDTKGQWWSYNQAGQVTINGVADTTTSGVVGVAWVNGVAWQVNKAGGWWSNPTLTAGAWGPATSAGTTSPLPATPAAPSVNHTGVIAELQALQTAMQAAYSSFSTTINTAITNTGSLTP